MSNVARGGSKEIFVGIMSGTSLDGIDAVAVTFTEQVEVHGSYTQPFPEGLTEILLQLATGNLVNLDLLTRTHFLLAELYAHAVKLLLLNSQLSESDIIAIGLHGQTIRHLPERVRLTVGSPTVGATLQLGSGPALAVLTGIDVVHDFRSADVAMGGQGAPLVPMFDAAFLSSSATDRIALNIGGIANLTWLPKSIKQDDILAFDTGPGNMIIDALTKAYFARPYDAGGALAKAGSVDVDLLTNLLEDPYFNLAPPKSTGRESFGEIFLGKFEQRIASGGLDPTDAVTTASELTVRSIERGLKWLSRTGPIELIVSGGGAKNKYLMESLATRLKCVVTTSDSLGIPAQQKEAIAFAYFAKAFIHDELIHLPRTTGARLRVMLGSLSKGKVASIK